MLLLSPGPVFELSILSPFFFFFASWVGVGQVGGPGAAGSDLLGET